MAAVSQIGNLSNVQLELLKAFSHNLEESDLIDLRKRLADFFAERLVKQANRVWDEKGWDEKTMENILISSSKNTK